MKCGAMSPFFLHDAWYLLGEGEDGSCEGDYQNILCRVCETIECSRHPEYIEWQKERQRLMKEVHKEWIGEWSSRSPPSGHL